MVENNNDQNIEQNSNQPIEQTITYQDLQNNNNNSEINVVNTEKDLADKTIETVDQIINTHDHAYEFTPEEVKKYKNMALLCYIPFVVFYFLLTGKTKESKYLLFHANQGLIVTIVWLITFIVRGVSNAIFEGRDFVVNSTPVIVVLIIYILFCISFTLSIFGIVHTFNGKSKELLVLGKIKLLK